MTIEHTLLVHVLPSPVGPLRLVARADALVAVLWPEDDDRVRLVSEPVPGSNPLLERAARQLDDYFAGSRRSFDLPLDPNGTDFQKQAWSALCEIPYGETSTYAKQAAAIGRPRAVRAIGSANGRNPLSIIVPCHRVVGADGKLTGFAGGLDTKRWLLDHERRVVSAG